MEKRTKIGLIAGIIILLLMCCCAGSGIGWYFGMGPGSYQTAEANKLVKTADERYKKVVSTLDTMDAEITASSETLNSEGSINDIEPLKEDIMKMESDMQEMLDDMAAADTDLKKARSLRMPEWYARYIDLLLKRDEAAQKGLVSTQEALADLRGILGSMAYVVDAVDRITTMVNSMDGISGAIGAGDYAGALALISQADSSLAAAEVALSTAGETLDIKEIDDMKALVAVYRDLMSIFKQAVQAIQAGNLTALTTLETDMTAKLGEAETLADSMGVGGDGDSWFEKQLADWNKEASAYFKEAEDLEKKADKLYRDNN